MSASLPLTTERLLLREFEEADWQAVHAYASDPDVVRYLLWGPNTPQDSRDFVQRAIEQQRQSPRRDVELAMTLRSDNRLIGACGIHVSGEQGIKAWIGYGLRKSEWGEGYATEAARALLAFGFGYLGVHRIFTTCHPENRASARILEKLGMQREGYLREDARVRGQWRDSLLYAILEQEWRAQSDSE